MLERKLTQVVELSRVLGHQWNWTGQVRELINKRDKTGISEELSKITSSSSIQIFEWQSKERVQILQPSPPAAW